MADTPDVPARRVGRFSISVHLIREAPEILRTISGCCIIVRAEINFATDDIEYTALCERFSPIPPSAAIPYYQWIIRTDETLGQVSVTPVPAPLAGF